MRKLNMSYLYKLNLSFSIRLYQIMQRRFPKYLFGKSVLVQTQTSLRAAGYICCVLNVLHATLFACSGLLEFFPFCQVLRGADRNIDFLIKDSKMEFLTAIYGRAQDQQTRK